MTEIVFDQTETLYLNSQKEKELTQNLKKKPNEIISENKSKITQ